MAHGSYVLQTPAAPGANQVPLNIKHLLAPQEGSASTAGATGGLSWHCWRHRRAQLALHTEWPLSSLRCCARAAKESSGATMNSPQPAPGAVYASTTCSANSPPVLQLEANGYAGPAHWAWHCKACSRQLLHVLLLNMVSISDVTHAVIRNMPRWEPAEGPVMQARPACLGQHVPLQLSRHQPTMLAVWPSYAWAMPRPKPPKLGSTAREKPPQM
jgi:hypothetical protein